MDDFPVHGMATARAASITRSTSAWVISLPLYGDDAMTVKPRDVPTGYPAYTDEISQPAINSAS
jgi:hypothetical protein